MEPFQHSLCFGVSRLADVHAGAEHAAECLALGGQLGSSGAPTPDRALAVPHQRARHRAELLDQMPPTREEVLGLSTRDQHRARPPRVTRAHRHHRQPLRRPGLAVADRQLDVGEPEVELSQLTRLIGRARRRVRWQVHRPQLAHPRTQRPDRVLPADPLRDNRGRHRRRDLQQLADPRLHLVDQRPSRRPLVARRTLIPQRLAHRVLRDPHRPGDHLDRHSLRTMQPADLSPVLH